MKKTYNCLVVDDEAATHYIFEDYIKRVNFLKLAGHCYDAIEGVQFLQQNAVDILFLDINMPELSGLEMLQQLSNPPATVLISAHDDKAIQAFELGVKDYLLKPFEFARFFKSVTRITGNWVEHAPKTSKDITIEIKADGLLHRISSSNIEYIESLGNYVKFYVIENAKLTTLVTLMTLSSVENLLAQSGFVRVHKSFIININRLKNVEESYLNLASGQQIPLGITYKRNLMNIWTASNEHH